MYRIASLIVAGAVVVAGLVVYAEPPAADPGDDPPMLKKKGAPDVDDGSLKPPADDGDKDKDKDKEKKPDAPKPDGDKGKPRPDPDEVLKDVAKSMRSAEEKLAKKELGDPTRQAQEDALKGLDSLIDLAQNPPDDQGGQDNKPDNKDNKDPKDNKNNPSSKPNASGSSGSKPGSMNRQGQRRQRTRTGQSKDDGKPDAPNTPSGGGQPGTPDVKPQGPSSDKVNNPNLGGAKPTAEKPEDPINKLVTARWGELTPTLREEMKRYADLDDMKSMPEYQRRVDEFRKAAAQSDSQGK